MKALPETIKIPGFPKFIMIFIISFFQLQGRTQTLDVDKTYNFSPTKLSKKEKEQKTKSMDVFWNKVKSDTTAYLPLLRKELLTLGHEPFFYFDGSSLLLWLDHSRGNEEIAAEAIPNCDLDEVDRQIYVQTLNRLAFDGINILQAAVKILKYPDYKFFLVEHVMYFNQENCLAYALLPMKDSLYIEPLISRFNSADTAAQFSILYTIWLGYSCRGDSLLKASSVNHDLYKEVRNFASTLLSQRPDSDQGQTDVPITELLEKRTDGLRRFSDEGLGDLIQYSVILRNRIHCGFMAN
ncbi:MAG: hypothetical protein Q8918_06045 [Bacteroidota bacterium]|nr:hypothetical protein [Bacteroidota bacterium]MDP4249656.1 hypothetical protein [Bacteroidota bacterium]